MTLRRIKQIQSFLSQAKTTVEQAVRSEKLPCVYILASNPHGTLYIGVTSDLWSRTAVHKQDLLDGFTKRYGVHRLVYYEMHHTMMMAIRREKQLKKWNRAWKLRLIEQMNPEWRDLFDEATGTIHEAPADIARSDGDLSTISSPDGSPPARG
jgi:putative endonuclease